MTDITVKPHLLTVRQVAIIIQVHPNTVMTYLSQGKLKGHNPNGHGNKGLRITVDSVRVYLRSFLMDDFDEKIFEKSVETATVSTHKPVPVKKQPTGWVRRW